MSMVQFAEAFPDTEIVAALRRQLGWTHFRTLIPLKDPLKREFYAEKFRATALGPDQLGDVVRPLFSPSP
uniref:DUF1016 N-terminal domain-containing protein n=1 Tax=Thiorhodovibrio frisius TaxID=631362 RepID=UPI000A0348DD|nr:DUF1016 N-terminal domain-containing protein [Thiorhodovibrio frisius]